MNQKKEKRLKIRSCLTGAIWLSLVFSTVISALLFAFLNHFFKLPGSIPVLGWLLIFNTLIAGLITSFINAKLLEPITKMCIRDSILWLPSDPFPSLPLWG